MTVPCGRVDKKPITLQVHVISCVQNVLNSISFNPACFSKHPPPHLQKRNIHMCVSESIESNRKKKTWEADEVEVFDEVECTPVPYFLDIS